jgi:hypothetical protein
MSLTRNALKHKKVRSVACGPAGAGRLEGLQVEQDANCDRGGCREWSAHSAPRFQLTIPSCRAFPSRRSRTCPRGNRNNLDIDHVEGLVPSPSTLKSCSGPRQNYTPPSQPPWRKKKQSARDKAEAIAAAVSARAKRGAAGDD